MYGGFVMKKKKKKRGNSKRIHEAVIEMDASIINNP